MSLVSGTRVGPYEIQSAIGAGGMGEVYKARDTRLDRTVAIKVLPSDVSADPERRARFEREAKTIARLNHAHICTLHDVGDHDGAMFLVMEHLAGQTLAERLEKGPLPLEQALTVATEIAGALSAAHRQGVIHRDLKPGNVMLTKAGAKLLDFGLAKLTGHGEQPAAAFPGSAVPTQAGTLTGQGVIVGTLQYMAPEQLEGKPADARTDIWALNAILYEMVTGRRAFDGASAVSLMSAILGRDPPPIASLQPLTPPALDRLVRQCLAKSPDDRPDTAHDVANALRWLREDRTTAAGAQAAPRVRPLTTIGLAVGLVVIGILLGVAAWSGFRTTAPVEVDIKYPSLDVRPADRFPAELGSTALGWTPDGKALVFVGVRGNSRQIYIRRLDASDATPISGTEGAAIVAVSPDGMFVAFWGGEGAIRKVPLAGGPPVTLAGGVPWPPIGLAWSDDGRLFFGEGAGPYGIREVMPDGTSRAVTGQQDPDVRDGLPSPLPGGQTLLMTVRNRWLSSGDEHIDALTLAGGARKTVLMDAADARYVPTGHLVFLRRGELYAIPFDVVHVKVTGSATPLFSSVAQSLTVGVNASVVIVPGLASVRAPVHAGTEANRPLATGAGQFAVSARGALAWAERPVPDYPDRQLVSVDLGGGVVPLPCPPRSFGGSVRLAPDGTRLAVLISSLKEVGLWTYDLERGTLRLIRGEEEEVWWPTWSRDGGSLYYNRRSKGEVSIAIQAAESGTRPRTFRAGGGTPSSFSPDGRLAMVINRRIVEVAGREGTALTERELTVTPAQESWPEFSPDGRWLAYASDYSRRWEVYVRPYPGPGPSTPVSVDGGNACLWHPNGQKLFFVSNPDATGKRAMMTVKIRNGIPQGRPRQLFEFDPNDLGIGGYWLRTHDISRDGSRFYTTRRLTAAASVPPVTHLRLFQNWLEELKAKVPPAR